MRNVCIVFVQTEILYLKQQTYFQERETFVMCEMARG